MSTFEVFSSDIEDRFDAPFYQSNYVELFAKLKKKYQIARLNDVLLTPNSISNGLEIRKFVEKGTPYLRASNVREIFATLTAIKYVDVDLKETPKRVHLKRGDILIDRGGVYCGKVCLVTEDITHCIISSDVKKIELNGSIEPEYAVVYLNSNVGKAQVNKITQGGVMNKINNPSLKRVKIPLISNKEQKKIAEIVKRAEKKRILANGKICDAQTILQNAIGINPNIHQKKIFSISSNELGEMFTPTFYFPLYVETLEKIKKEFTTIPLDKIAKIGKGVEVGRKNYQKAGVPFVRTTDIIDNEVSDFPDFYVSDKIYKKYYPDLREKDILFTKDGKIGFSAMIMKGDNCIISTGVGKIRTKMGYDPYYLFAILNSMVGIYQARQRTVIAATIPHLAPERLGEIIIPLLNEDEQNKISKLIREAFELKREKKALVRDARELLNHILGNDACVL